MCNATLQKLNLIFSFMHPVHKIVRTRPRLTSAIAAGIVVWLVLPGQWHPVTRALTGWNVTVWLYLCLMGWLMMRASHARVRQIAEQEDKSSVVILAIMSIAAMVSFAAIILELSSIRDLSLNNRLAHYAFTVATVFGTWCLVATLFTFHYARIFTGRLPRGGHYVFRIRRRIWIIGIFFTSLLRSLLPRKHRMSL